jgi:hypothetical protein
MEQAPEVKAPEQVEEGKVLVGEVGEVDMRPVPMGTVFVQAAARKLPIRRVCHVMSKDALNVELL